MNMIHRRERLVVVGNGMAGTRAIEEILARAGADMFQITVFGDERSEERRVGKECRALCRSRWSPYH